MAHSPSERKRITKAVIPAAGKGARLLPLTKAVPKELVPLGRKPVLEWVVEETVQSGTTDIIFVISEEKTAIRAHFGEGGGGVRFQYTFQRQLTGLADAIYQAREFVGEDAFAVVLGDSIIYTDEAVSPMRRVADTYETTDAKGVILVQKTPLEEVGRFGIVKPKRSVGPSFEIDGLVEKPLPANAPSEYAIAGRYAFDPLVFRYIERTPVGAGGEHQITDSIDLMLRDANEVWCVALGENELRRDIGTFESYFEALRLEMDKE